jgi:RimJ/RimL family protein N-acetyltransferase
LLRLVTTDAVTRFVPPPPDTLQKIEEFIAWTTAEHRAGRQWCFAIVPHGSSTAAGLIQVRRCDGERGVVEWGFLLAERFWGTGVFVESARRVLDALFAHADIRRVRARTALLNDRGTGVLRKMGFVPLRRRAGTVVTKDGCFDQALWEMTSARWQRTGAARELLPTS